MKHSQHSNDWCPCSKPDMLANKDGMGRQKARKSFLGKPAVSSLIKTLKNSSLVLQTVMQDKREQMLADFSFRKKIDNLFKKRKSIGGIASVVSAESSAFYINQYRLFQYGIYVERDSSAGS